MRSPTTHLLPSLLALISLVNANIPVTGSIQPSTALANVNQLPANTIITLSSNNLQSSHQTLLLADNTFLFRNVSAGSYLLDVHCLNYVFAPLRVDVKDAPSEGEAAVTVYQTFRGNEWSNLGERKGYPISIQAVKAADFYVTREGFNPAKLLSNPMILIGIVSVGGMLLMPKLLENMDPEMKEEFEKTRQQTGLANPAAANPLGNFDMAGFLAGKSSSAPGGQQAIGQAGGSGASTPKVK